MPKLSLMDLLAAATQVENDVKKNHGVIRNEDAIALTELVKQVIEHQIAAAARYGTE